MELTPLVPLGTVITLNGFERETAVRATNSRRLANVQAGLDRDPVDDLRDRDSVELDGVSAEIAFCHLFNVYCDLVGQARRAADDDGDCQLGPYRVDVKGRPEYGDNWLLVSKWKRPCDLYALMTGAHPRWCFRGFMTGRDLFSREPVEISPGKPPMFKASQSELYPLSLVEVDDE